MSQFGLLLVTDEPTIRAACRGWETPLAEPVKRSMKNPFTGQLVEVVSYVPDSVHDNHNCTSLDEVHARLKQGEPVCIDFQLHHLLRRDFLDAAVPFLIGNDEHDGPVTIDRIPDDLGGKVAEYFREELGPYANATTRREGNLSMYVLVYSF
jgi:hypothetical protein